MAVPVGNGAMGCSFRSSREGDKTLSTDDGGEPGRGRRPAWLERLEPKRARVPSKDAIAVRVASEMDKRLLLEMDPDVFFTEPHYDGYAAILVRLPPIELDLLREVLTAGWRCRAPRRLREEPDASAGADS